MPVAFAADTVLNCCLQAYAQFQQVPNLRARPAPLLPVAHPYSPPDPFVQLGHWPVVLADAEVPHPTPHILPQLVQPVFHRYPPAAPRQLLYPVLERRQSLIGPAYLLAPDGEVQKAAVAHGRNPAFGKIDFELEGGFQVSRDAAHYPLCGALAFDKDDHVVPLQGATVQWPVPSPGTSHPLDALCPGSA